MSVSVRGMCLCQSVSQGYVSVSVCVSQEYVSVSVCVSQGYVSVSVRGTWLCQSVSVKGICLCQSVSVRGMCLCQSVFVRDISLSVCVRGICVCLSQGHECVSQRYVSVSVGGIFVFGSLCQSGVFLSLAVCVSRGNFLLWQSVSVGAIRLCPSEVCVCVSLGSSSFFL